MILIVIGGLPGAGKTTVADRLAREIGAQRICLDDVADRMIATAGFRPDMTARAYDHACRIATASLSSRVPTVVDCINPTQIGRARWKRVAAESRSLFLDIELTCARMTADERCRRKVPGHVNIAPWRYEDAAYPDYETRSGDAFSIDTSHRPVVEIVMLILAEATRLGWSAST